MKKLILGLVIGLTLGMSTNAFAAIGDTVSAVFASFNYVVNGEAKTIDSPVLVYEGVSYVRTTDIGNMLGYDVTYKSDSRTIAFSGGTQTPILAPETTSTGTVTDTTYGATPTPAPSGTPSPSATPSPTLAPGETPAPTVAPSQTPIPTLTPTPVPSNTGQCQSIRDSYASQIAMLGTHGYDAGHLLYYKLQLEYARDQSLSAAGCN